ncbi:MAG: hypothetical protein K0R57_6453 [Paenibacillaceae bacterium]|jgi:hypothetical protein|nr:hypothetical protein [Paenibacillaceae bacterium]
MKVKYQHKTEALKDRFPPFPVSRSEIVLTSVSLNKIGPKDRIVLRMEVGWDKPLHWDMGELELILRAGAVNGPIVFLASEACFYRAHTKLEHVERGGAEHQIYYLSVISMEDRARIVGPYSLEGIVYED